MCGICGFITKRKIDIQDLMKMNATLVHRGPNDHGEELYQMGSCVNVGLAQRRLAIIDLSANGHQPMHSSDKRISVVFNGEIYNFKELKEEIKEYEFKTKCDTEVIIAAYLKWGEKFVNKLNGMFAIALFDRGESTLYLYRDRIGKKPLYYYVKSNNEIVFASELKAIMEYPFFDKVINKKVLGRFLYHQYINYPDTVFENTYKLEPGTFMVIKDGTIYKEKYWDISEKYLEMQNRPILDYEQAKEEVLFLLKKSVARRLIADVPLGAFLSGGYDSSLICALAQEQLNTSIQTFCIGVDDKRYDEAQYAKRVASYLGTDHHELYIGEKELLNLVESIPRYYDEPFADSSQIPTMLVSVLAKKRVSVVLTGDGGDELFGGYPIYQILNKVQQIKSKMDGENFNVTTDAYRRGKAPLEYRMITDKNLNNENATQTGMSSYISYISSMLLNEFTTCFYEYESKYNEPRYDATRMLLDMETYLPEDILTKVDRGSMRVALECRAPFLDKEVIEYSYRLPIKFKNESEKQKRIIKDIAYTYIPKELLDRPKAGFSIPIDKWLRGALKERLIEFSDKDFLRKQNIFDADYVFGFINNYIENGDDRRKIGMIFSKICWPYFVFQQWYQTYML